jgi:hypothetical protein
MATTTNYGWATPDDTDLVKDGAAAIRTLGSSADTTVKALSPGTTAGDLDYYTSGTAKARLGIGTAGQILQVNSGATAPEWATSALPASGLNFIQRSTFSSVADTGTTFDGVFTSTYKSYMVVIELISAATAADDLHLQFRASGVTTTTTYNSVAIHKEVGAGGLAFSESNSGTEIKLLRTTGSSAASSSGALTFYNVGNTANARLTGQFWTSSSGDITSVAGDRLTTTFDGFLLKSSSTNISGTVAIYGLAAA